MIPKQTTEQNIADFKVSLMPIMAEYRTQKNNTVKNHNITTD